jgi:predicted site-specific integrase-resolvase
VTLLTTREVAARLGVTVAMVKRRAKARGVKPAVDQPRMKMWRESDVRRLMPRERAKVSP